MNEYLISEAVVANATKEGYQKKYKCPYCDLRFTRDKLPIHIQNEHEDMIPEGYTALRVAFNTINNKTEGHCIMCGKVTDWNEDKGRYERLCNDPKCHEAYKKMVAERTKKKYGTERLQTDPEYAEYVQRKALAGRKMHGVYKFADGGEIEYFGSYEKKFLQFMDQIMNCKSEDILAPAPSIKYSYEGKEHLYIPDFYYIPYNLIIEIKDGGSNPNNHPHRTGDDEMKLRAKEDAIRKLNEFSYVRVTNNDFSQLMSVMAVIKYQMRHRYKDPVIKVNESCKFIGTFFNESSKSTVDKDFKPKEKINLSSLKKVHLTDNIIEKYKDKYPDLKHVRCRDTDEYKCDGYIWLDKDDNLVSQVGSCEYFDDHTKWIVSLEIVPDYKGHGLSKQILDFATKTMKCKYLSVAKDNKLAIYIYKQYGFKVYYEDKKMYYMTLEANPNPVKVDESTFFINERYLINEKDIYYNKNKFDSGEINLCFITGLSGSGKSTMARGMESKDIENYELDDLQCIADHFTLDNLKEYGDLIYSYFTGEGKKFYTTLEYLKDNKVPESEYEDKLFPGFVHYAMKYAKQHPKKKYVLNGVWLYREKWFKPEYFKDYAFYIKGTSMIISKIRGAKRDSQDAETPIKKRLAFINMMSKNWKWFIIDEKSVTKFRKYFSDLMSKNEAMESMSGAIGSALPLTPNPIPYESNKDNYYIIQHKEDDHTEYSITKDPVQYSMYSVDPTSNGYYKVFKTDKGKINKKYTTFKIRDKQTAKELYDELATIESGSGTFFAGNEYLNDYVYQKLTNGSLIKTDDQIKYDTRFEQIKNFDEEIQDICETVRSYILGDPIDRLYEQVSSLTSLVSLNEADSISSNINISDDNNLKDWENKIKKAREAEIDQGLILIYPDKYYAGSKEDIDKLKVKYDAYNALNADKRNLSSRVAFNIFGYDNDTMYSKLMNTYVNNNSKESQANTATIITPPIEQYDNPGDNINYTTSDTEVSHEQITDETSWRNVLSELCNRLNNTNNESKRNAIKNEISILGWNPEIPFNEEALNRVKSSRHKMKIFTEVDAEEYLETAKSLNEATYEELKDKIVPVFICLFKGKALHSKAIELYTHTEWSHAAMSFDSSMKAMYTFNANKSVAANDISSGFTIESIDRYLRIDPSIKFKVHALFVTPQQRDMMKDAVDWYIAHQDDTKYSMKTIINIFFKRASDFGSEFKNKTEMVCSQFVYTILAIANLKLKVTKDASLVSPGDLDNAIDDRLFSMFIGGIGLYNSRKIDSMCKKIIPTLPLGKYNQ